MYHNSKVVRPDHSLLGALAEQELLDDSAWDYLLVPEMSCGVLQQEAQQRAADGGTATASLVWEWEPVEAWHSYARNARDICVVAKPMSRGWLAKEAPLEALEGKKKLEFLNALERLDDKGATSVTLDRGHQQHILTKHLERWIELGRIIPRVSWSNGTPVIRVDPEGLFGALALQLLNAVSPANNPAVCAVCDGCGQTYMRHRRPPVGQRNFCDTCRDEGRDHKFAMRDKRTRDRQTK
jgi:hypothetical protein